jgi:hypothetical protein
MSFIENDMQTYHEKDAHVAYASATYSKEEECPIVVLLQYFS